ncbi:unnamed protein product [Cylindrotheca closterium]|uniref:Pentacotripeptide-repeat region of PRORP domain-containing protein n=1 Tax=Cylindrotheca closterium TaxID=2856 RepID=A0AAD2FQL1_9STRA|nr:unnamed protein product [Cylindrotheca closterium]
MWRSARHYRRLQAVPGRSSLTPLGYASRAQHPISQPSILLPPPSVTSSMLSVSFSSTTSSESAPAAPKRITKSQIMFERTNELLRTSPESITWEMKDWRLAEKYLHALSRQPSHTSDIIRLSFSLLERMVLMAERNPEFRMNTEHLNIIVNKWRIGTRYNVVHRKKYSAPKVLAMIDDFCVRIPTLRPDTKTYAMIMAVQTKLDPSRSPTFCTEILNRMKPGSSAPPNSIALTNLMDAHVRGQGKDFTLSTLAIFDHMVNSSDRTMQPNVKSLTRALESLLTSGWKNEEAVPHMNRVLGDMLSRKGRLPNSQFLSLALSFCLGDEVKQRKSTPQLADALMTVVEEKAKRYPQIAPEGAAYANTINLLAKSDDLSAPERAEYWLQQMLASSKRNKPKVGEPRASLYTSVIAAWERSGLPIAPTRAETIFDEMMENTTSVTPGAYYLLISLWSKSDLPEAPVKAEEKLRQMIAKSKYNPKLVPSLLSFVNVISAWKRSTVDEAPERAHAILDLLLDVKARNSHVELNEIPFNIVINAWASSGSNLAEAKVDEIISRMNAQASSNPGAAPSIVTALSAMKCLSCIGDGPKKTLKLLDMMDSGIRNGNTSNQHLRSRLYEEALKLWQKSTLADAPQQAEQILHRYLAEPNRYQNTKTTKACFEIVLELWQADGSAEASERLESCLKELERRADDLLKSGSNVELYAFLAQSLARSGLPKAATRAESVLDLITERVSYADRRLTEATISHTLDTFAFLGNFERLEIFLSSMGKGLSHGAGSDKIPNTYYSTISALVNINEMHTAHRVLLAMVHGFNESGSSIKPTARCFGPIMKGYADAGEHEKVHDLWTQLNQIQSENSEDPDFFPSTSILAALCKSEPRNAIRDHAILHHLLEQSQVNDDDTPDAELIYSVLDALVQSRDSNAGSSAEMTLLKMQELYEEGRLAQPTFQAFQKAIDCWAFADMDGSTERAERLLHFAEALSDDGDLHLRPTYEGYKSVISAWATSHMNEAPERIQRHIRKIKQRHDMGEEEFKIDSEIYASLIKAYANSGRDDATLMAQTVFDNTPVEYKTTILFNALIAAQGGDALQAEAILNQMHEKYLAGDVNSKPNTKTFNNLISSWSKSGSPMAPWRADSIFKRMEKLSNSGQLDVKPDGETFDTVIATLSNDWGADAASKVDRYLELMRDYFHSGPSDCMPSVVAYTSAIRAWGSNIDDPRAVLRAKALLDEMHELAGAGATSVKPDQNTYLVYLDALSKSAVEGKEGLAQDALISMQENGVQPDDDLLIVLQRCSIPVGAAATSFSVSMNEEPGEFSDVSTSDQDDPLGDKLNSLRRR